MNEFKINSNAPDCYVVFFPYAKEDTSEVKVVDSESIKTNPFVVSSEIIQVSTNKSKNGVGSFSIVLGSNKRIKSAIHAGCWVAIFMSNFNFDVSDGPISTDKLIGMSKLEGGLKMVGSVKSIRKIENLDENTGTRSIRYQISGEDFHSFLNSTIHIDPINRSSNGNVGNVTADSLSVFNLPGLNSQDITTTFLRILQALLGYYVKVSSVLAVAQYGARVGGCPVIPVELTTLLWGKPRSDFKYINSLNLSLQQNLIGHAAILTEFGTDVNPWSLFKSYSNPILNEIITDMMPVTDEGGVVRIVPTLLLRAIPFSSKDRYAHPSTLSIKNNQDKRVEEDIAINEGLHLYVSKFVEEGDILQLNHGKSDAERFNYVFVSPDQTGQGQMLNFHEAIKEASVDGKISTFGDINSIARYGLRPYIVTSGVLTPENNACKLANYVIRDMWLKAHLYENGQLVIPGDNLPTPVGTNVVFKDRKWIAHIEAVSNVFGVSASGNKSFNTTISFVRLQNLEGKPIDAVDDLNASRDYEPGKSYSGGDAK